MWAERSGDGEDQGEAENVGRGADDAFRWADEWGSNEEVAFS